MNALALEYPRSNATACTGMSSASISSERINLARWRQAVKLNPVSATKRRLNVRDPMAAQAERINQHYDHSLRHDLY